MANGIQQEDVLEHPMYNEALESVNVLKARCTELVEMVEKTKGDIAEIDAEQLAVPTALFDGDVAATPRQSKAILGVSGLAEFQARHDFPY